MPPVNEIILVGGMLILISILIGLFSARIGAPLLLVFLVLGMLAGAEGPGGIRFDSVPESFMICSICLAIILFDGGLRTPKSVFRVAAKPSLLLATLGVVVTAAVTALFVQWLFALDLMPAFLVGSIVASTDAAAVFFLLHLRGMDLKKRVSGTLEIESGANDPMAAFLTLALAQLIQSGATEPGWQLAAGFAYAMGVGAAAGIGGGYLLAWAINRLTLAPGLYPIFAVAGALTIFSGTQVVEGSGFLAVYLAGLILGNTRLRALPLIGRFHDGLSWLSQIVMFLLMGLLVTPSKLLPELAPALAVAVALIFVARPVAVVLCLQPFRFSFPETAFIAWVGLRGGVTIFLALIPLLVGVGKAESMFHIAFVVVLSSLVLQGWTVPVVARWLKLGLPTEPDSDQRLDFGTIRNFDRDLAGFQVAADSAASGAALDRLRLPARSRVVSVIRAGTVLNRQAVAQLEAGDYVLAVAPPDRMAALGRLFAARGAGDALPDDEVFGEFAVDGASPMDALIKLYGISVAEKDRGKTVGEYFVERYRNPVVVGDRVACGPVDLIARSVESGKVARIGVELDPGRVESYRGLSLTGIWHRLWRRGGANTGQ